MTDLDIKEMGYSLLKKFLLFLVMFLLIELVLLGAIDVLSILLENSISEITTETITSQLAYTYQNVFTVIQEHMRESNLLFIMGTMTNVLSCLVALFNRRKKKNKEWETQQEGYHGSAHWATKSQIMDNKSFTKANKNTIQKAFKQSLQKENHT